MKLEFSQQNFEKKSTNMKFNENSSNGCVAVPCGRTDRHDKTTVALRNFANGPKNESSDIISMLSCHSFNIRRRNPLVKNNLLLES